MPLDAVAGMVDPTRTNARHWIISGVWRVTHESLAARMSKK